MNIIDIRAQVDYFIQRHERGEEITKEDIADLGASLLTELANASEFERAKELERVKDIIVKYEPLSRRDEILLNCLYEKYDKDGNELQTSPH